MASIFMDHLVVPAWFDSGAFANRMPMAAQRMKLTDQINQLIDRRQSGLFGAELFSAKKRNALRLPPTHVVPILKWLTAALLVNVVIFWFAVTAPNFGRNLWLITLVAVLGLISIALSFERTGVSNDFAYLGRACRGLRRAVSLDLGDDPIKPSDAPQSEMAALRYLRDAGELTRAEFAAAQEHITGTFKPRRKIAGVAAALLALNIGVFVTAASWHDPLPPKSLAQQIEDALPQLDQPSR
jgi:hypothetical protein